MNYKEAMKAADAGSFVCYPGMGKGWTIGKVPNVSGRFCFNPHTGSEYGFTPSAADKARTDWRIAKNKRDAR